ncbi:MAG: NAD(P)-binding domain-containing protein [Dehalococcoidia bacterium]
MTLRTDVLVIGAGPFGLGLAAELRRLDLDHVVVGRPMEFWRKHMPHGMFLRSASDWSLDPTDRYSMLRYLEVRGETPDEVEPLSRDYYLGYADWFRAQSGIETIETYVVRLDGVEGGFHAVLEDGGVIEARRVVIALGMGYFEQLPDEVVARLPVRRFEHTRDAVDLARHAGRRVLIVGGRQSAYEWAALLNDAGAAQVHLSHRHDPPAFAEADWAWVTPLVDGMVENPSWFRALDQAERDAIARRMWGEGRLKVEPWLERRVVRPSTHVHARTALKVCTERPDGALDVTLDNGEAFVVDDVILATGYRVDMSRVPLLAAGNLLERLDVRDGWPVLSEHFETSVPGVHVTSMPAGRDFGPFFGFTVSVRASARIIGRALATSS